MVLGCQQLVGCWVSSHAAAACGGATRWPVAEGPAAHHCLDVVIVQLGRCRLDKVDCLALELWKRLDGLRVVDNSSMGLCTQRACSTTTQLHGCAGQ